MSRRFREYGLVGIGLVAGILVSLNFSAIADKDTELPLPVDDLRAFSEVFGRIKSDYVEPVSDKALITSAINGMLSGLCLLNTSPSPRDRTRSRMPSSA